MKKTSFWLLTIGVLGTVSAVVLMIIEKEIMEQIPYLVCSTSLLGAYYYEKKENSCNNSNQTLEK